MATVITSIGSKSEHSSPVNAQITVTGSSGSGTPWAGTVVYSGSDPTVNVGDILHYKDAYYNCDGYSSCANGPLEVDYLITAINTSTNTLTIRHIRGGIIDSVDPFSNLDSDETGTLAQPYIVRCFSSISAWEAELDTDVFYDSDDTAQGEMYDDSDFSITGAINITGGGTIDLKHRTLTAAVGQRHDGTANTGVRLLRNADSDTNFLLIDHSVGSTSAEGNQIEWLEFDANEKNVRTLVSLGTYCGAQNNLVHGGRWSGENQYTIGIGSTAKQCWICNNIIYDLYLDNGSSDAEGVYGIYMSHIDWIACVNNTVYNVKSNSSTSGDVCVGMHVRNGWYDPMVCNNICLDTTADNGDSDDFGVSYGTQANVVSNYSSDDTSTGVDYQRGQSAADTFVSVDSGTEDFHLKNGSNALRAGKDMGANEASFHSRRMPYAPYDWDVDINGRDRDSEGDDWDIGAHQCEGCSEGGGTTNAAFWLFFD